MQIIDLYDSPDSVWQETGQKVVLSRTSDSGQFGIAVFNARYGESAFAYLPRHEMAELRDALNRAMAS